MKPSIKIFPVFDWNKFARMSKPGDPSNLCPSMSFVDDYLAQRGETLHYAIDIFVPEWTPVVAVSDGVMWPNKELGDTDAGWKYFERGGWHCYLKSNDGYYYYYAHLMGYPVVNPWQSVKTGQILGFVGRSGVVYSCPHLHFASYESGLTGQKGPSINPYRALKDAYVIDRAYTGIGEKAAKAYGWLGAIFVATVVVAGGIIATKIS